MRSCGALDELLRESASNLFVDQYAAGGGAALAGGPESSPECAFDGEIEMGIVHDDHGVFAADSREQGLKLEAAAMPTCGRLRWTR